MSVTYIVRKLYSRAFALIQANCHILLTFESNVRCAMSSIVNSFLHYWHCTLHCDERNCS